jgi:hypothetical protein
MALTFPRGGGRRRPGRKRRPRPDCPKAAENVSLPGVSDSTERRRGPRHQAYLAAELVVDPDKTRIAITKDISDSGLLLLTRARLSEGQQAQVKIYRPGEDDRPLVLSGRVVRRQALSRDEIGTWREKVAFAFDDLQPELASEFAALVERQSKVSTIPPPFDA